MLLSRKNSMLLLVDVQEKLISKIINHEQLVKNCKWLMEIAKRLHVPVLVSEQYPKGLGPTVPTLRELVSNDQVMEKLHFSCAADNGCVKRIDELHRSQIVIIGIEAHVCVLQTAIDLHEQGKQVFVVADAVSSRSDSDKKLALKRLRSLGIQIISKEMAVFEWLHQSGTPEFKQISQEFLR